MVRTRHRNLINIDDAIIFIISMMANGPEKWYCITLAACVQQPWLRDCVRNLRFRQTDRRIKEKRMQSMKEPRSAVSHRWMLRNYKFSFRSGYHVTPTPPSHHPPTHTHFLLHVTQCNRIYMYLSNARCEHDSEFIRIEWRRTHSNQHHIIILNDIK